MHRSWPQGRWPAGVLPAGVLLAGVVIWPASAAGAQEAATAVDDAAEVELGGGPLAPTEAVTEHCEPALVTVTPGDVDGQAGAVAITSQSLELDVPGWVHVSWEAAEGTALTAVTVRTSGGLQRITGELSAGTAEDVQEIVFCGTTTEPGHEAADGDPAQPGPTAADDQDDGAGHGTDDGAGHGTDDGDTEVLGISSTRSEDAGLAAAVARRDRAWSTTAALAALAGAALLLRARRRPAGTEV